MWNGLWKLAVMVGVVGVGLVAAYQAQKGMNLSLSRAPSDVTVANEPVDAAPEDPASLFTPDAGTSPFADQSPMELAAPTRRERPNPNEKIDLTDEFAFDSNPLSRRETDKTEGKIVPVKRTQKRSTVSFREDADSEDFGSEEPKKLPSSAPALASPAKKEKNEKKDPSPIRQVKAESTEEPAADSTFDPFADDATDSAPGKETVKDATETEDPATDPVPESKPLSEPETFDEFSTEEPAATVTDDGAVAPAEEVSDTREESPSIEMPAEISTESTDAPAEPMETPEESEPPRSKRAQRNAGKRVEEKSTTDADPFDADAAPPLAPPEKKNLKIEQQPPAEPVAKEPDLFEETPQQGTLEVPANKRPALPVDLPDDASEAPPAKPSRKRTPVPAELFPEEPSDGFLSESPPKSTGPRTRRDLDKSAPSHDMMGDGVAGAPSQRGVQQPRLTIEKVAREQAVLDQPFIYSILVKNVGTVDAHNVVIEDRIPKGTELLGTAPQAELVGKRLIWNHQLLKPNEEKKISIKVVPKQEGPVGSVARVYFATEVSAEIVVAAPQLEFTVKAPSEVRIGQHFDMTFTLRNIGTVDASNVIVRDLVPDELKHEAGADIECPIGKMGPGETREIILPVVATKTGNVVNKAMMTADSGVKKGLDSSIDIIGEVLVLSRSGHNKLYVERTAAFSNTIRNDGNRKAEKVRVAEVVPAGMQFETASDGGTYDPNLRAVVWTVGPLAPGADKTLTVNYVPKETGTHATKITATGNAGSSAVIQASVDVVGKPELQMETLSATGTVTLGDRITSKFQLSNSGTAPAENVQLRIKLPRELRLVSVKGAQYQQKDNVLLLEPISELLPRAKASYEVVMEPIAEADAQIKLEISAKHLSKPGVRIETIQISRDSLK